MAAKPIHWVGSALDDVRAFGAEARQQTGYQLYRVQNGMMPTDWKPMSIVGRGVHEIRIRVGREYRVLYLAARREAVYVLHAFEKKTQKTRTADIELAKERLALVPRVR